MRKHHGQSSALLGRASERPQSSAERGVQPSETPGGEPGIDVLSDVLRTVRLTGALFFPLETSSPWVDELPAASVFAATVLPGAQHVVSYHIVMRGGCWAALLDRPAVRLEAGDVLVVPHGDPYVMSSAPDMRSNAPADWVLSFFRQMTTGAAPTFNPIWAQGSNRTVGFGIQPE